MRIARTSILLQGCVFVLPLLLFLGCTQTRIMTIRTKPSDAIVRIDNVEKGHAPIVDVPFVFESPEQSYRVAASRLGFRDVETTVTQNFAGNEILLELKPDLWHVIIRVMPGPGIVTLDGKPLNGGEPASQIETDVDMSIDAQNNPIQHEIVASRPHFNPAVRKISRLDRVASFELRMEPMKKSLAVTSTPAGATVTLDGEPLGTTPLQSKQFEFPVDLATNEFIPRQLRVEKPGYDVIESNISWDDGKTDYPITFSPRRKEVRFFPEPADATVTVDGREVARNNRSVLSTILEFPPITEKGDLKTYNVVVSHKPSSDQIWEPKTQTLGWDNNKVDYRIALDEDLARQIELLEPAVERGAQGWDVIPKRTSSPAMKNIDEPTGRPTPQLMTQLAKGSQLGSLAVAPDGQHIVFTILTGKDKTDFHSQMRILGTNGNSEPEIISDGKSLDIMPSYTPGGDRIVFSSNRAGSRLSIWQMPVNGMFGITQLTNGDSQDLWPVVDSDPQARLFYQAMVDTRPDARLYTTQMGTVLKTDLSPLGGMQPRISPKNDAILFVAVNDTTGKRDILRMSDRGSNPENLTRTPDSDECDVSWSKDGGKIIFASDRGTDDHGRANFDIWMIDFAKPDQPIQLTANGSRDDCPVFDATGRNVFFRSNRGGAWGIWKIAVK